MEYHDAPDEPVSVSELIRSQQEILARNGENQRKRERAAQLAQHVKDLQERVDSLAAQLQQASEQCANAMKDLETAQKSAEDLQDESTAELEASIRDAEEINRKVRANLDKARAEDEARSYADQYKALTDSIDAKPVSYTHLDVYKRQGVFYALLAAIVLGGAAEVTMAQWASAFLEKGLRLPKLAGDVWGVCFFSLMLALGRSGYAALGARVPLHRLLIGGSGAAAVLYVVCALAQSPLLGVLACGLTGLCVSLLWPGAIILASRRIPSAGAAMFALLSAGGDVGASLGAFCVGRAADWAQASGTVFAGAAGESGALRAGLLLAAVFPLLCCGVHTALHCTEARGGLPAGSERRHRQ